MLAQLDLIQPVIWGRDGRTASTALTVAPGRASWRRLLRRHSGMRHLPWRRPLVRHSGARGARPGIHPTAILAAQWIPGSRRFASRPGMTKMICPTGKSAKPCPPPVAKIYRFAFDPKHLYKPRRLAPSQRGVSWSSRNVGAGCDGRRRYRKTNGTGADGKAVWSWRPTLASSLWSASVGRRWQTSPITGESAE